MIILLDLMLTDDSLLMLNQLIAFKTRTEAQLHEILQSNSSLVLPLVLRERKGTTKCSSLHIKSSVT